jgi:lysozyme
VITPALGATDEPGAEQIAPEGMPATGLSDTGMNFIKEKEGFTSRPKWDYKQNSIGYGTKALPGETTIDPDTAEARARAHADKVAAYINKNVKVPLAQNQYDALVSFGYRLGEGTLDNIISNVNKGDFKGAAERILKYRQAGGKDNDGVIARSEAEAQLFSGNGVSVKPALEPVGGAIPAQGGIAKGLSSAPTGKEAVAAPVQGGLMNTIDAIKRKLTGQPEPVKQAVGQAMATGDKGGLIKRLFGIDFNPLQLSDNERIGLIAGGFGGAKAGVDAYTTMRGQDMNQAQSAAQLAETKRQHIASTGLQQQSIDQAKTSFGVSGQNPDGTPQYGFIDAAGQTLKPSAGILGTPATKRSGLQGEEHLATLDPYIAEQARRVSQGLQKLPVPSKYNPSAKPIADAVRQAYPDYSEGSYDFIQKWNDPDKGTSKNIKAANTFYQHAGKLYDLADALPSSAGGKFLNTGKLWFRNQTNDPNLAAYIDVAKQVVDEKIKAITGASPTVSERDELMKDYDPAKGKETIRRVLAEDSHLIEGRSKAVESDYNKHIPRNAPKLDVFDEESKKVMDRLKGKSQTNQASRPVGMSNTQLIRMAQETLAKVPEDKRAAATVIVQQQLKAMGAL